MNTRTLIALADKLANDLLMFARENRLGSHDLLMATALSERLLQEAVASDPQDATKAVLEADATFKAVMDSQLEVN